MPSVYDLRPKEKVYALLIGERLYSLVPENNRVVWHLGFYTSEKSRLTAAKKKKRRSPSAIFIAWEFTLDDIIKQGQLILVQASERVLLSDKLDIFRQIRMGKKL